MKLHKSNGYSFIKSDGFQIGIEMSEYFGSVYIQNRRYISYETFGLVTEGKRFNI